MREAGVSAGNIDICNRQLNYYFLWHIWYTKMPLFNSKLAFFLIWGIFFTIICLLSAVLLDILSFTRTSWHWHGQFFHNSTYHHCRSVWGRKKDHDVIYLLYLHSSGKVGFLASNWPDFWNSVWPCLQFNVPWALIRQILMYTCTGSCKRICHLLWMFK